MAWYWGRARPASPPHPAADVERPDDPAGELGDPGGRLGRLDAAAAPARHRALGDVGPAHRADRDDLAEEVARGVDHVGAHVGDHAGAPARPLMAPAEGELRVELAVVEVGHAPVPDLAEVALVDEAPEIAQRGCEPERERHHVDPARVAAGGVRQVSGFGIGQGQRLLAEDVLAGGERRPRQAPVEVARRADDDGIELGIGDQGLPGVVHAGDTPLLREGLGLRRVPGRDRRHLREVGEQAQTRDVHEAGDAPRADNAHSDPLPGHLEVSRRRVSVWLFPKPVVCPGASEGEASTLSPTAGGGYNRRVQTHSWPTEPDPSPDEAKPWPTTWRTSTGSSCRSAR